MATFFFTVLIFTMITVIVDFSEKVERFVESDISRSEIIFGYFPNFVIFIHGMLFPLFTLISVVFFTSRLANNSEILSIFNAGVSFRRLLRPYLLGAFIIAVLHAFGSHYFIPKGTKIRLNLENTYFYTDRDQGKQRNIHLFVDTNTVAYINFWRKSDSVMRDIRLETYADYELKALLKAATAAWQGPPNKWRLTNYEMRTFDGLNETIVIGQGEHLDTSFNLAPVDLIDYRDQQSMMTTPELAAYIAKQKARGAGNTAKYEAEYHRRMAEPVTVFILCLIGVAVAARKVRGGLGIHLAIGVVIGALFLILSRFSAVFAAGNALPIVLSVWLPNMFFGAIAAVLVWRAQQ
ncbi:MAG: YjgP/YjgQ family permease [Bacteroidetes bacterium]|nr:MAG: YjgP/YjgQ family permease [Bacteroidota bacterium]